MSEAPADSGDNAPLEGPQNDQEFVEKAKQEEHAKQKQREAQAQQHSEVRQQLEEAREQKVVPIEIDGVDVPFKPPGSQTSRDVIKIGRAWNSMDEDAELEEIEQRIDSSLEELTEILENHAMADDLTAQWWEDTYGVGEIIGYCNELAQAGVTEGVDPDELKNSQ